MNGSFADVPAAAPTVTTFVPTDGSDVIVFDDVTRRWHRLPGTTATIWAAVDGRRTTADVVSLVASTHRVPVAAIVDDVVDALERLAALGLLHGVHRDD